MKRKPKETKHYIIEYLFDGKIFEGIIENHTDERLVLRVKRNGVEFSKVFIKEGDEFEVTKTYPEAKKKLEKEIKRRIKDLKEKVKMYNDKLKNL